MKTICLNMIVKNESRILKRCLDSVKPLIDTWVIVDTGSSDGTQDLIRETLREIPGALFERPWVDFSTSRNEALALARGHADYLLFIDADEELHLEAPLDKSRLIHPAYLINLVGPENDAYRAFLIDNHPLWRWQNPLHEYIFNPDIPFQYYLENAWIDVRALTSARSQDPHKYLRDAQLLEKVLQRDPHNTRNVFYLAQSYRNAGKHRQALKYFQQRARMGGWKEEVFWSLYSIGLIQFTLRQPAALKSLQTAYEFDPARAEPLYHLSLLYQRSHQYLLAHAVACLGLSLPQPTDKLFVCPSIYQYQLLLRAAETATLCHLPALDYYIRLKNSPHLPPDLLSLATVNIEELS